MRFLPAALVALVAVSTTSSLRQYPRRDADNFDRYKNSDFQLEPPRPEEFEFFNVKEEKRSPVDFFFDDEDEHKANKKPKVNGKSRYHSDAKLVPEVKPIFDASEPVEHRRGKDEEETDDTEEKIRCVKVDTKPVTADDVYSGRFRRATKEDKVMTCFKCEDLQKGGFYQKCSYGTDPKNKAFFISHEQASSSNDKPKFRFTHPEYDENGEETEESRIERQIKDSFFQPSSEYLEAAKSIGKYTYDGPDFSSSNTNYRYEIPESSLDKTRVPSNHPTGDYYQPSPSYLKSQKKSPDDDGKGKPKSSEADDEYAGKPSEHRYSSYGEKETSKGKKGSSEEEGSTEDGYSGHPSEQSYDSKKKSSSSEEGSGEEGSEEYSGKPTEYHFKTSKKTPVKSYSSYTTDPPVDYYYETKESSPSQKNTEYASSPADYVYTTKKKQPTKLYSYETTDKPVAYEYRKESKTEPKRVHQPAYEYYSPTEFTYSKSVDDPLKTYYESSSYGDEDDKPAEGNAPKEQTVEAPKGKNKQTKEKKGKHAPQVRELSTTDELPDSFVAQPSEELKKAMGAFLQKDRTNCTQVQRDKMSCWQCIDEAGTKQEECMYVASSQPAAYQTAFSDRKENVQKPGKKNRKQPLEPKKEESVVVDQKQVAPDSPRQQRRRPANVKHRVSAVTTTESRTRNGRPVTAAVAATSTTAETRVAVDKVDARRRRHQQKKEPLAEDDKKEKKQRRRRKPSEPKKEASERQESTVEKAEEQSDKKDPPPPPTPKEFEVPDEQGAFSAETRMRYNKRLGMSLPEYMVTKSDFEAEFDRAVQAG